MIQIKTFFFLGPTSLSFPKENNVLANAIFKADAQEKNKKESDVEMATVLILQDSIPSKKSFKTKNISLVDEETGIVSVLGDKSPSCLRIV